MEREEFEPEGIAAEKDPKIEAFINSLNSLERKDKLALIRQSKFPGIKNRLRAAKKRLKRGDPAALSETIVIIEDILNDIKDM